MLASFGVAKDTIVAFENLFCLIKKKKKNGEKLAGTCWNQHVVVERVAESLPKKKKESIRMGLEMRVDAVSNYTEGCLYFARR